MRKEMVGGRDRISHEHAVLDEFIAACLDHAQQQLIGEGAAAGTIHFGYGMNGEGSEPAICHYALTRQDTDKAAQELSRDQGLRSKDGRRGGKHRNGPGGGRGDAGPFSVVRRRTPGGRRLAPRTGWGHAAVQEVGRPRRVGEPRIIDPFEAPFLQGLFGTAA